MGREHHPARRLWAAPMPGDWPPGGVVFTADGRVLVGATDLITPDAATGKQLDRRDLVKDGVLPADKSNNTHLYPSRDGHTLGFVIQSVGIFLVDSRSWKLVRTIDTPEEVHWPLTFSPDGRRLASGGIDGTALVWDLAGVK